MGFFSRSYRQEIGEAGIRFGAAAAFVVAIAISEGNGAAGLPECEDVLTCARRDFKGGRERDIGLKILEFGEGDGDGVIAKGFVLAIEDVLTPGILLVPDDDLIPLEIFPSLFPPYFIGIFQVLVDGGGGSLGPGGKAEQTGQNKDRMVHLVGCYLCVKTNIVNRPIILIGFWKIAEFD